nr:hypothetical protein [Rhodococcus wratislaviensis]GLK38667.1 hypothetical protein GCM10017611_55340 [Rhodococcus wratislaviensis]
MSAIGITATEAFKGARYREICIEWWEHVSWTDDEMFQPTGNWTVAFWQMNSSIIAQAAMRALGMLEDQSIPTYEVGFHSDDMHGAVYASITVAEGDATAALDIAGRALAATLDGIQQFIASTREAKKP